jgi:hypothetical protein
MHPTMKLIFLPYVRAKGQGAQALYRSVVQAPNISELCGASAWHEIDRSWTGAWTDQDGNYFGVGWCKDEADACAKLDASLIAAGHTLIDDEEEADKYRLLT